MTRTRGICTVAVLVASTILLTPGFSQAATISFVDAPPSGGSGTDFRIDSINNLDIGGTAYDISFQHGALYSDLINPITFGSFAPATSAVNDIVDFINGESIDASLATIQTDALIVPFAELGPFVTVTGETNIGLSPLTYSDGDFLGGLFVPAPLAPNQAILTFALATAPNPEPSTLAFCVMAMLICTGWRGLWRPRRRRLAR